MSEGRTFTVEIPTDIGPRKALCVEVPERKEWVVKLDDEESFVLSDVPFRELFKDVMPS